MRRLLRQAAPAMNGSFGWFLDSSLDSSLELTKPEPVASFEFFMSELY